MAPDNENEEVASSDESGEVEPVQTPDEVTPDADESDDEESDDDDDDDAESTSN